MPSHRGVDIHSRNRSQRFARTSLENQTLDARPTYILPTSHWDLRNKQALLLATQSSQVPSVFRLVGAICVLAGLVFEKCVFP